MKNLKKLCSALLVAALILAMSVSAFAADTQTVSSDGGSATTTVTLTADAAIFNVTVPTSIAVRINSDGSVTCPSDVKIVNNSTAAVKVSTIEMRKGTWSLVPFTTDMSVERVDANKFGFSMTAGGNTAKTTSSTDSQTLTHSASSWTIEKSANLPIQCSAVASAVSKATTSSSTAASIIFTLTWA